MGYGIKLSDDQWDELDRVRFSAGSADVFRNCLIVLMSHSSDTIESIAGRLGCCTDTVKRVRRLYRQGGAAALRPIKPPGRPGRATPEYLGQMRLTVRANPMDLGYGFSVWSVKRLAEHLAKVTRIRLSDDRLRNLLHRHGYSVHRPKHTLKSKRDEIEYNKAKRKLVRLKNAVKEDAAEALVFQDEVEIHRHPTLTRMWAPVGTQPEVPAPGQNEKKVVYGGIDYATGKITHTIAATKSGFNFLAFLIALATAYAGRKVRLVCDNGSFHYTKPVAAWLEANRDKVEIFWLPPYCPSLNLIERLWGHLKRTVLANVLFKDMDDLTAAFQRGVKRINGHREKMAFIFDHDDVLKKTG